MLIEFEFPSWFWVIKHKGPIVVRTRVGKFWPIFHYPNEYLYMAVNFRPCLVRKTSEKIKRVGGKEGTKCFSFNNPEPKFLEIHPNTGGRINKQNLGQTKLNKTKKRSGRRLF